MSSSDLVIGTRKSELALWQANHVKALIDSLPIVKEQVLNTKIQGILSTGDKNLEIALSAFSDKGVFTKELDIALLSKEIDIAVHSMKDLPTMLPEGIALAAVPQRGNVLDAMVFPKDTPKEVIEEMGSKKEKFVVGSSSLRRRAMLSRMFDSRRQSNLESQHVRGNVNTRLRKLDSGEYDALLLACAGLERLKMEDRISVQLQPPEWNYYAVCQGALAVVCREDDERIKSLLSQLTSPEALLQCTAERSMLRTLEGGCKVPIGVRSELLQAQDGYSLVLSGIVLSTDGKKAVEASESSTVKIGDTESLQIAKSLGEKVAKALLLKGADSILKEIRDSLNEESEGKDSK